MKRLQLLLAALLFSLPLYAQGVLEFSETTHDFGKIPEQGGKVRHRFEFVNSGETPVLIRGVSSSCGCTAAAWSREPVLPGKKGFIEAEYNPLGRPNAFTKALTVTTNSKPETITLFIKGFVEPRPKTLQEQYPFRKGDVGMPTSYVAFNRVYHDGETRVTLSFYNFGSQVQMVEIDQLPDYITITPRIVKIRPQSMATAEAVLDGRKIDEWGYISTSVKCKLNGEVFTLSAGFTREENFFANAQAGIRPPVARFDATRLEMGRVKSGEPVTGSYTLTNTGEGPLIIRRIISNCDCLEISASDMEIAPQKSTTLTAKFNTRGYRGSQMKDFTLITNDPNRQYVRLELRVHLD